MLVLEVCAALAEQGVRFALVGGYAVALHGAVRGTVDVDVVLACTRHDYVGAARALESLGLVSRLPVTAAEVFEFRAEYLERRNLIAWSFIDPSDPTRLVDIILTHSSRRLSTKTVTLRDVTVPVLSKASLIRMKEASGRPQDLEDVAALRRLS